MSEGNSASKPHPNHLAPGKEALYQPSSDQKAPPKEADGPAAPVLKDWASI